MPVPDSKFRIQNSKLHLYLAPHLDDAVLSCGGTIYRLVQQGKSVIVYTLMAADPPRHMPVSPILRDLHSRWQAGEHPIIQRREEDSAALAHLGAQVIHGPLADCVYRVGIMADGTSQALYPSEESLWGNVSPHDPARTLLAGAPLPVPQATVLHAPLGAGDHVDHLIMREWGQRLGHAYDHLTVLYYEEYPYNTDLGAIDVALAYYEQKLAPVLRPLDEYALSAKIEAIAYYKSQISTFWSGLDDMAAAVRAYAQQVGAPQYAFAEREWQQPASWGDA